MKTNHRFLTGISIRVMLIACVLLAPSTCPAATVNTNFTTDAVFNLTEATQATLLITANWNTDVQVQISYLGSKPGQPPFPEVLIGNPIEVTAGRTKTFNVNLNHLAFKGGYGAVRVRSVDISGAPSSVPFIAYLRESDGETLSAVSGDHLVGYEFYIPTITARSQRLRVVITIVDARGIVPVTIRSTNGYDSTTDVPVGATFRWDSKEISENLTSGSIRVFAPSRMVVSIYYEQEGPSDTVRKYHVHLPAAQ